MTPIETYELSPAAMRDLRKLDVNSRQRIFDALDAFVAAPREADVRKLAGRDNEWRLRVGTWRIIFRHKFEASTIIVVHVLPWRDAYRR